MFVSWGLCAALRFVAPTLPDDTAGKEPSAPATPLYGIELAVDDVAAAVDFYVRAAGFVVEADFGGESDAVLVNGELRLLLRKVAVAAGAGPGPRLDLRVPDPKAAALAARAIGGRVGDPTPTAGPLGSGVTVEDPSGNPLRFVEIAAAWPAATSTPAEASRPAVLDVRVDVGDVSATKDFFAALGLRARSHDSATTALLRDGAEKDGAAERTGVLLEARSTDSSVASAAPRGALLFACDRLETTVPVLAGRGIALASTMRSRTACGLARSLRAPDGVRARLVERSPARRAFERLRSLAGDWKGKSTKGWTDIVEYKVIAHGTVVMRTSFDAHPGETMASLFHMDGERLMLTHYCVAGNQPRLVATKFEDGGNRITFEFLDGGDLDSRDQGHMDKHEIVVEDADHFRSRWTWYEAGHESWMEDIEHVRAGKESEAPLAGVADASQEHASHEHGSGTSKVPSASPPRALLWEEGVKNAYPHWSHDGSRILYQSNAGGKWRLYVMNKDGSGRVALTEGAANDDFPDWSPDNSRIAFVSDRSGNEEICVMNADGSDFQTLTRDPARDIHPYWSQDGTKILFSSTRSGDKFQLYEMSATGGEARRLVKSDDDDTCARVSPNGDKILYLTNLAKGQDDVIVRDRDGGNPANITADAAADGWPVWTPDGAHIVFSSARSGIFRLFRMDSAGGNAQELTTPEQGSFDARASVSPDGRSIVFNRERGDTIGILVLEMPAAGD